MVERHRAVLVKHPVVHVQPCATQHLPSDTSWMAVPSLGMHPCTDAARRRRSPSKETEDGRESEHRARQVAGEVVVGWCRFDVRTVLDWKDKATSESPQSPAQRWVRISTYLPRPVLGAGASVTRMTQISVPQFWLRLQYAAFGQRSEQGICQVVNVNRVAHFIFLLDTSGHAHATRTCLLKRRNNNSLSRNNNAYMTHIWKQIHI
jgi:hypothetical protein